MELMEETCNSISGTRITTIQVVGMVQFDIVVGRWKNHRSYTKLQ
jgi:hypothetical protein